MTLILLTQRQKKVNKEYMEEMEFPCAIYLCGEEPDSSSGLS